MATIRRRGTAWHVQVRRRGRQALTRSFSSKKAAELWAREQDRNADLGRPLSDEVRRAPLPTLGEALDRYRAEVTVGKRGAVQEGFLLGVLRRQPFATLEMPLVTPTIVAAFRDRRLRSVSPATVRRELAVLSHCFEIGRREWGIAVPNPVKEIRLPSPSNARERRLTDLEQVALDDALARSRTWYLKPLVALAIETGMRKGELLSLEWKDVHLERRTATLPLTKNGSRRVVPLTVEALAVLKRLSSSGDLVFPVSAVAVRQAWDRVTAKASIPDFRFHDLRHEAISRFFEMGLTVAEVAFVSGHKDVRMLFRYTHLRADHVLSRIDAAERRLGDRTTAASEPEMVVAR
jgi:integrase